MKRKDALEMQERLFPRRQWLGVGPDGRPNGCVREIAPTLLEIAMDVRHAVNGHADSWPSDTLAEVREMLKARLVTWAASQDPFDELVRRLVVEAVSLIDGELSGGDSATYTHGAKTAGEVLKQLESCDGVRSDCVIIGWRQARLLLAHVGGRP